MLKRYLSSSSDEEETINLKRLKKNYKSRVHFFFKLKANYFFNKYQGASIILQNEDGYTVDENGYTEVYTDGACSSNGRGNAQAGVGVWFGENHPQ